jgi:hypothetical protein
MSASVPPAMHILSFEREIRHRTVRLLRQALNYPGAMPLVISLSCRVGSSESLEYNRQYSAIPLDLWTPALEKLSPHAERIRRLTITKDFGTFQRDKLAPFKGSLVKVFSLQVYC